MKERLCIIRAYLSEEGYKITIKKADIVNITDKTIQYRNSTNKIEYFKVGKLGHLTTSLYEDKYNFSHITTRVMESDLEKGLDYVKEYMHNETILKYTALKAQVDVLKSSVIVVTIKVQDEDMDWVKEECK